MSASICSQHAGAGPLSLPSGPRPTASPAEDRAMTMRRPYEVTISLCIRHPMIEPSWITETLGIEPQHAWKAGDPRRDGAGRELGGVHRESYWLGRVPQETPISPERMPIETVVTRSLVQLRPC